MNRMQVFALILGACLATASEALAGQASESSQPVYRDVTLHLEGALPNSHRKLQDDLELTLGRTKDGQWRRWVLGYSAFVDPASPRPRAYDLYNWMDDEGVLKEVDGDNRLTVEMNIHPDLWVAGGKLTVEIELGQAREGVLAGSYKGTFVRSKKSAAGPAGRFRISGEVAGQIAAKPWPSPVEGHKPLAPGEHPRLFFRQSDVASLRRRARTPMGREILNRLRKKLDSDDKRENSWRGYGFGLLYQLTGERNHARKGLEWCEAVIAGKMQSPRYGWDTRDGGYMRIGPSAAAVAATYDMCYHAWSKEERKRVAGKLLGRIWPNMTILPKRSETDPQFSPRSNHYLLWNGGAGLVALAILGDPGVDANAAIRAHRIFQRRLKRGLVQGYGDHGWFYEGTFCGRFPANIAATQYIRALRVAEGKDYVAHCSEAEWLVSRWMYEVVRSGGKLKYHTRGMYERIDQWDHFNGDFAMGFGILPESHRPAALWFCRNLLEPQSRWGIDATGVRELVHAYINWPDELAPTHPGEVLPHTLWDREARFFVFRSGWKGEGDIVVSMHGDTQVLGMGLEASFPMAIPAGPASEVKYFRERDDRVTVVSATRIEGGEASDYHFAADFSEVCGSDALLVGLAPDTGSKTVGEYKKELNPAQRKQLEQMLKAMGKDSDDPDKKKSRPAGKPGTDYSRLRLAGRDVHVMTVQKGPGPAVHIEGKGDKAVLVIGRRRVGFDGKKLVLTKQDE